MDKRVKDSRRAPLRPLTTLQNKCLRRIPGAYKRTLVAALENDSDIPPFQLYTRVQAYRHALNTNQATVEAAIRERCDRIGRPSNPDRQRRRQKQTKAIPREALSARARKAQGEEVREENQQQERQQAHGQATGQAGNRMTSDRLEAWYRKLWRQRWEKTGTSKTEATWRTP
jgi:hypothetical protein